MPGRETLIVDDELLVEELNEKISGNEIKLFGYEKNNSYSGENEFSVKEVL